MSAKNTPDLLRQARSLLGVQCWNDENTSRFEQKCHAASALLGDVSAEIERLKVALHNDDVVACYDDLSFEEDLSNALLRMQKRAELAAAIVAELKEPTTDEVQP